MSWPRHSATPLLIDPPPPPPAPHKNAPQSVITLYGGGGGGGGGGGRERGEGSAEIEKNLTPGNGITTNHTNQFKRNFLPQATGNPLKLCKQQHRASK